MKKKKQGIFFGTKEENNERRRKEFLRSFDSDTFSKFVNPKDLGENKGNFCIYKK